MRSIAVAVSFAVAATILAQKAPPPASKVVTPEVSRAPEPEVLRKLTRRERKDRTAKIEPRHQDFVADVEPIILPAELDTFLMLETEAQRDAFVDEFWRRRDAAGGIPTQAFRTTYYARLEIARDQFRKVTSDRARMFLLHGPPAAIITAECQRLLQPLEIWRYDQIRGMGQGARLLFYRPRGANDYRLWNPIGGATALADLLSVDSNMPGADQAAARRAGQSASPYAYINKIQIECKDGEEIMRAITQMVQARIDLLKLFEPPQVDDEDVRRMLRSMVAPNPNAPKMNADFSVAYPGKSGSRTDVQMTLLVPRGELRPSEVGGAEVYTLDVTGEVLRDGNLWEKYHYRFDYPGDVGMEKLPVVIDRFLRPDDYIARIKVTDATGGAEALIEQSLVVPEIFSQAEEEPAEAVTAAMTPPTPAALRDEVDPKVSRLRIIPPTQDVVSGIRTIETIVSGDAIKAVEFWLDGRRVAVRRAPPYALDFDFGLAPQLRRIRAVALDATGEPITGDELEVNAGTDPFRVRIVSPRVAPKLAGPVRVEVEVRVPDGDELGVLELFWNETRLASLYDPPFVQAVTLPSTQGVGYLRAVAQLKDATIPPIEDLVLVNSPAHMEEVDVHLIELPTTVIVEGKPSSHLGEKAFRVFDDGKQVSLSKFEYVKNLPLSIGLAVDTSGSMQPQMDEARKAGAQFVQNVMRKGDKAFLVAFNSEAELVQKWSTRVGDLHAGLARLRAENTTAIYDAVIFSLYNFQGIRGQRALVVISDGKDTASKFTFDQAIEYARRSGVPIYGIGIAIKGNEIDARYKLNRLCAETGGTVFYIDQARDLQRIYDEIQTELRSQYVLGFYPSPDVKAGGKWREVKVETSEGKARTIKGYFP